MTSPASLLECRALTRTDSSTGSILLHPTDLALHGGDRVALRGASGSGKSVLLRALALLEPAHGMVLWQGQAIARNQIPHYRSRVCYVPQKPTMLDGSVLDNLRYPYTLGVFASTQFDREKVSHWLRQLGKPDGFLEQTASELSGGEAQIVALARTIQLNPHILLLDEPTAALDPASTRQIEELVAAWFAQAPQERALVWISHDPDQATRVADRHLVMSTGHLTEQA